jgi:cellulose synthase (UDP-forming)
MYFATMWSYLSGPFAVVYLVAPVLYLFTGIAPVNAYSWDFFSHLVPYLVINQLVFIVIGRGRPTWRGQQYSLALFPLWIKALTSTIGNVYFHQPLGFVVTPKVRQGAAGLRTQWRLIWPQLAAITILVLAAAWGVGRVLLGRSYEPVGVAVNLFWVAYDLLMLSVVVGAASYRPREGDTEPQATIGTAAADAGLTVAEVHGRAGAEAD